MKHHLERQIKLESNKETAEILAIPHIKKDIEESMKQIRQRKGIPLSKLK